MIWFTIDIPSNTTRSVDLGRHIVKTPVERDDVASYIKRKFQLKPTE